MQLFNTCRAIVCLAWNAGTVGPVCMNISSFIPGGGGVDIYHLMRCFVMVEISGGIMRYSAGGNSLLSHAAGTRWTLIGSLKGADHSASLSTFLLTILSSNATAECVVRCLICSPAAVLHNVLSRPRQCFSSRSKVCHDPDVWSQWTCADFMY